MESTHSHPVQRLLTNDRFRGQRLLCQRRAITMNLFCNLAPHPAAAEKMRSEGALVAGTASTFHAAPRRARKAAAAARRRAEQPVGGATILSAARRDRLRALVTTLGSL